MEMEWGEGEPTVEKGEPTVKKILAYISAFVILLIVTIAPVSASAQPIKDVNLIFSAFSFLTFQLEDVATAHLQVYDHGVTDTNDPRFNVVTPGAGDYTYFIDLTNESIGSELAQLSLTTSNAVISSAGVILSDGSELTVASNQIASSGIVFNFQNLGGFIGPGQQRDLYITSPYAPGDQAGTPATLVLTAGGGSASLVLMGPSVFHDPTMSHHNDDPTPTPEPGTLLLLGSGLLGLAALGRKRLLRHGEQRSG